MENIFYKDKSQYTNQLNIVQGYLDQLTTYIHKKKNLDIEQSREIAKRILKDHYQPRTVVYYERENMQDRVVKEDSLLNYINNNLRSNNILVPTFTSYLNPEVEKSILSEFIAINVKKRSAAKKLMHKAKAEGNTDLYNAKNNEQNMMKIYNNSLSGAFAQKACILYNPTAHSTLTSITRTITSLSNANNEKLVAGNRYYRCGRDILNNITYIITYVNKEQIKSVMQKYNLHYPTVEETIRVLKYSSDLYMHDVTYYNKYIIPYLNTLNPEELAAICYIGDLYQLKEFNSDFIKNLIDQLTTKVEYVEEDDPVNKLKEADEAVLTFALQIWFYEVRGYGKDFEKMHNDGLAIKIYATYLNIINTLIKYKDFFNTFFMQNIFPNNSFRLNFMRRRTVVLSDTDSTCFTLDNWVKWYYNGEFRIDSKSIAIAGCISYIASQAIKHQLALLSRYMNIPQENLDVLSMKNEFLWLVHDPCEVSKHYFAYTVMQEGNVFTKPDIEIKGVHLKNSANPQYIVEDGKKLMHHILDSVANNRKINLREIVRHIIELENNIEERIKQGNSLFFKRSKIKDKEAYALDEMKSPYHRHTLWVDVFSEKYGNIPEPPYDVIKIPTVVDTRRKLQDWLDSIEDESIRTKLSIWLDKYNKSNLPTIYLFDGYADANGIPKEIISVIDINRIILEVTIQHRIILETLGLIINDEELIKDQFNV